MPTMPGRENLLQRAISSFQRQQYPPDWQVNLCIDNHPTNTLGRKINGCCASTTHDYIVLLDDDDWHNPTRVQRQVEPLVNCHDVTGTSKIFYHDIRTDEAFLYSGNPLLWLGGLAFKRSLWEKMPFEDITQGPDTRWQNALRATHRFFDIADPTLFIASIHNSNACKKHTRGEYWKSVPISKLGDFPRVGEMTGLLL